MGASAKSPALNKILEDEQEPKPDSPQEEAETSSGEEPGPEEQGPKVQFEKVPHKHPSILAMNKYFRLGDEIFQVYDVKTKQRYHIRRVGVVKEHT